MRRIVKRGEQNYLDCKKTRPQEFNSAEECDAVNEDTLIFESKSDQDMMLSSVGTLSSRIHYEL